MTMQPFKIQSPTLSLNGVNIDTSAQGKLVIPGVTRAGTSVAIEVNDTGDQSYSFGGNLDPTQLTIIDGYTYEVNVTQSIQGQVGWTAATYAADAVDGEGYIDGITVTDGGAGYTGEAVAYSQTMWATNDGSTWIQIPFAVRCGAGSIESEFGGSGGSGSGLVQRTVNFPTGEDGDTAGTMALDPSGNVYVCTADYVAPEVLDIGVENTTQMVVGQSGGQSMEIDVDPTTVPQIVAKLGPWGGINQYDYPTPEDFTLEIDGVDGVRTCIHAGYLNTGNIFFTIAFVSGDPDQYDVGLAATVTFTSATPAIWEQLSTGSSSLGNLSVDGDVITSSDDYIQLTAGNQQFSSYSNVDVSLNYAEMWTENDIIGDNAAYSWIQTRFAGNGNTNLPEFFIENQPGDTGVQKRWTFDGVGAITFPDGSVQTTAFAGQSASGNGTGWGLQYGSNVTGNSGGGTNFNSVTVDADGNSYYFGSTIYEISGTNNPLVVKVSPQGVVLWSTTITDFSGAATGGLIISEMGNFLGVWVENETDGTTTNLTSYNLNVDTGAIFSSTGYNPTGNAGIGIDIQDVWGYTYQGVTSAVGFAGFTTGENQVISLTSYTDAGTDVFTVLKTDVPGLGLNNYTACYVDSINVITNLVEASPTQWTVSTNNNIDFTTGSHTIQIPQNANATIGFQSMGPSAWVTVGTPGDTYEFYRSTAFDGNTGNVFAVGNDGNGRSIVSSFAPDLGVRWHKSINFNTAQLYLSGVALDSTGFVYVVGDDDNGSGYVTKMDQSGVVVWQTKLDDSNAPWGCYSLSIAINASDEIIVAAGSYGSYQSQNGDIYIVKFDKDGGALWQRSMGTQWQDANGNNYGGGNVGTRFVTADNTSYYLALYSLYGPGPANASAIKLPLDGSDVGIWGSGDNQWTYKVESWTVTPIDVTSGATAITDLVVTPFNHSVVGYDGLYDSTIFPTQIAQFGAAVGDRLVNGEKAFLLNTDGSVTFPDDTTQFTAYPGRKTKSPDLLAHTSEQMSNGTVTGITFTVAPHSVVVVASSCETGNDESEPYVANPLAQITDITGMGLTWIKRAAYTDPTSTVNQRAEIWYAVNTSNQTLPGIITITFDNQVDDQSTVVSSFSGCNLESPWSSSGPQYSNTLSDINASVNVNITESNTTALVFFAVPNTGGGTNTEADVPGYVNGWSPVDYRQNGASHYWEYANLSYKQFEDPVYNTTVVGTGNIVNTNNPSSQGFTAISDALVGYGGGLDRISYGAHSVVIEADGRLTLGDGSSMLGRVRDDDVVLWTDDTAEYVGLWYGGNFDLTQQGYGPVSSFTIGNADNDDLYRGPGNGGNQNKQWTDGPQANLDLKDKNWHFDGVTGDLTLPEESIKGSFTNITTNGAWDHWLYASVAGPDGTIYAIGGENTDANSYIMAHDKNSVLWRKSFDQIDSGNGQGTVWPRANGIKYNTQNDRLYVGISLSDSVGVVSIDPITGDADNSWIVRVSDNDSAWVNEYSFTIDGDNAPIIAGRSNGGQILHNNVAGTPGVDLAGGNYITFDRRQLGDLSNTFEWSTNQLEIDSDGTGNWIQAQALDRYSNVPVSYVGTPGTGGQQTFTEGTAYSAGAITGYDNYGLDLDASMWTDQTGLGAVLADQAGAEFTVVMGGLTEGAGRTVYTFSSVSNWNNSSGTMYHIDGNWTLVSGPGTIATVVDILSITRGVTKTVNVSSGTYDNGIRAWYYVQPSNQGTNYQAGDRLRVPGSLLGGVDSTTLVSGVTISAVDGTYGSYRMFIDNGVYDLSAVDIGTTVNVDTYPGTTGYVTATTLDTGTNQWVITVTTDMSSWAGNNAMTISFVNGNDFEFTLDQWGNFTERTGTPSATSYRFVLNSTITGNGDGTYNFRRPEGQQAFIWNPRWAHTYGTTNNGEEFYDVAYDPVNDTVYATGYFQENNNNSQCLVLALNNLDGTVKWEKFVGDNNLGNYGYASSISVDPVGDVICVGTNDSGQAMITKLNGGDGSPIWQTVQTNMSNWNNEPCGTVDANGDVYFGNVYYDNTFNTNMLNIVKLHGNGGNLAWSRIVRNTENYSMGDMWDDFQQTINVSGGQVQWAGYTYDTNDSYRDGIAISLPLDGSGTDQYGRWIYFEDTNFTCITGNDSFVVDPQVTYDPTDLLTAAVTQPSVTFYNTGAGGTPTVVTRQNISSGLPGIVFADGSDIVQAGIERAFKDTGDSYHYLDITQNGKFMYFYGSNGYSTVQVPQNNDVVLPIGFTVTLVVDDFSGNGIYVNTGGDASNGLHIGAVGFSASFWNNNYWRIGADGNVGVYTLMKVDTNRWILSGPNVQDDS